MSEGWRDVALAATTPAIETGVSTRSSRYRCQLLPATHSPQACLRYNDSYVSPLLGYSYVP